ncbi:hypothetical protein ACQCN2_07980 [Brevibacillus ginsengisoli]|uniref:hypothetical protein n=1 Tax=Brevibacillus ginsengisoli TaxID=363854 RepID=UPI003CEAF452
MMKKILYALITLALATIVFCFSTDRFMLAYGIILFFVAFLTVMGQYYRVKNSVYLHKQGINDDYDYSQLKR